MTSYTFKQAIEGNSDRLALFQGPEIDTSVSNITYQEYRPNGQLNNGGTIVFNIAGTASSYIDLKKTRLNLKVKITKLNGDAVQQEDVVAFVNNTLHSLFRQVDVSLQQQVISSDVGTNYPYKAMMDMLLGTSEAPLDSQLFYKDRAGFMESTYILQGDDESQTTGPNSGLVGRWLFTKNGQVCELEGPLLVDILQQDRLLLNGVRMDIQLYPHRNGFVLMTKETDEKYKFEITDAVLKVAQNNMSATLLAGHDEALKSSNALYPFTRSDIKAFSIPAGSYTWSIDNVFQDNIPSRVVLALVSESAFNGHQNANPFNFQHFNVNYLGFLVNGQSRPGQPFQPDYANDNYASAYASVAKLNCDQDTRISRLEYPHGYCMYVFDIEENGDQLHMIRKGHTRLILKMTQALEKSVILIVYGHFPAMMEIDQTRKVQVNAA